MADDLTRGRPLGRVLVLDLQRLFDIGEAEIRHMTSADRVLGTKVISAAWRRLRSGLRIVGYHEIRDIDAFEHQVRYLVDEYRPVSGADVVAAYRDGQSLPDRAVWVTFDDGRTDVVDEGLPVLERHGVPATLFVCPGLVMEQAPLWTHQVRASSSAAEVDGRALSGNALAAALKKVPDSERRRVVSTLDPGPVDEGFESVGVDGLRKWIASGQELGNHTWDHPCLDQCTPEEQKVQIDRAHEWLTDLTGTEPTLFAYPNGDWTRDAAAHLAQRGYGVAPLFDHGIATASQDPYALSRLRLDAYAPLRRARAVLSGAHSTLFGLKTRGSASTRG